MTSIKFALVLDKPSQNFNKGSNVLYLGDFELCNAGDRSARIYVGDSNGDIIEIDDILDEEIELFKQKILKVVTKLPDRDLKPQLLYMISDQNNGHFSKESIEDMYVKFKSELVRTPYCLETKVLGIEHKLFPFISDKVVFGRIDGTDLKNLMDLMVDYTNQILNSENQIFTTMTNLIEKISKGLSDINSDLADYFNKMNECITRLLGCIVMYDDLLEKYNSFLDSRADELKVVIEDHLEDYGSYDHEMIDNYSLVNIYLSDQTESECERSPFVDILIGVYERGTESLLSVASFRIDRKLKYVTNYYGDPMYVQPQKEVYASHHVFKIPIYCKNRLKYKIISNTSLKTACEFMFSSPPVKINKHNEFNNVSDFIDLNNLVLISAGGVPCYLDLTVDNKNGRVLELRNLNDHSLVNKYRSTKFSSVEVGGKSLVMKKNGIVGYFALKDKPDRPNGPHLIIRDSIKNEEKYIGYDEKYPIYNKIRFTCSAWDTRENYGTDIVQFYDYSGNKIFELKKWLVFPTWANKVEYVIPSLKEIKRLNFHRFIDTHSHGNANLLIEILPKGGTTEKDWVKILDVHDYRTGPGWDWRSYDVNVKPKDEDLD